MDLTQEALLENSESFFPSGRSPPLVRADAIFIIKVDFPSPESPCNKVSFPYGIYGYHALTFLKNWMRTAKEK